MLPKSDKEFMAGRTLEFWSAFRGVLDAASSIAESRGSKYDDETPIYYRWSPEGLVHEIKKKAGRVETILKKDGWADDKKMVQAILQETPDIVNYAAYLGALCQLLQSDLETDPEVRHAQDYP